MQGTLEKHGGNLTFSPNGAQGTTFLISLPLASAEEEENPQPEAFPSAC